MWPETSIGWLFGTKALVFVFIHYISVRAELLVKECELRVYGPRATLPKGYGRAQVEHGRALYPSRLGSIPASSTASPRQPRRSRWRWLGLSRRAKPDSF